MPDIHHRIGVESPSTDGVYAALTTIDGLAGSWTADTTGDPGLKALVETGAGSPAPDDVAISDWHGDGSPTAGW